MKKNLTKIITFCCLFIVLGCEKTIFKMPLEVENIKFSKASISSGGDLYCKPIVTDWYDKVCTTYMGVESCTTTYAYTEYSSECYYTRPTTSFGGGYSGGDNRFTGAAFDVFLNEYQNASLANKIKQSSTLTTIQFNTLNEALNDFINPCLQNQVFKNLLAKSFKFNFSINYNQSAPASFNPINNNMVFKDLSYIQAQNLNEEIFHGYQDSYYDGGTAQYLNVGKSNIEFEAKLYKDLVLYAEMQMGSLTGIPATSPYFNEYKDWIEELTSNYTKYPSVIPIEKYFYFLVGFKQGYPEYNYPTNPDLYPDALMNLIKSSPCAK